MTTEPTRTRDVLIGLGSNLGDREENIRRAVDMLRADPAIRVLRVSSIIETEPLGPPQPHYLNAAALLATDLPPQLLLDRLHQIEHQLGRLRTPAQQRYGPRTIDLDILLIEDLVLSTPTMTVPHPEMHLRSFVLVPLAEIAPDARHPLLNKTVSELLADLENRP